VLAHVVRETLASVLVRVDVSLALRPGEDAARLGEALVREDREGVRPLP